MDQRDVQIIVELYRQPFASHSTLGRAVGLTGKAVQARLERMTRAHVLNGFYVMPSAAVFRRHWQVIPFGPLPIEPPLEQLLAVTDVVNVWRGSPRTAMVNVYSTAPDSPPPPRLAEILSVRSMEVVAPDPPDRFSFAQSTLSSLDWRVLDAMLENPREPLARLAERSGLTARTVRRHRDSLWAKGLVSVVPNLDTTGESGLLVYSGFVVATQKACLERVQAPGLQVLQRLHRPPAVWLLGQAGSYAELQELEVHLRELPGIVRVDLVPSRGGAMAVARIRSWIRKELDVWKTRYR